MNRFGWHAFTACAPSRFPPLVQASRDFRWMNARASWPARCAMRSAADGRLMRSDSCFLETPRNRHLRPLSRPLLTRFEALYAEFSLNWGCIGESQAPRMGGSAARKRNLV